MGAGGVMMFVLGLFAGWVIGFVMCAMLSARTRHEDEQAKFEIVRDGGIQPARPSALPQAKQGTPEPPRFKGQMAPGWRRE